MTASYSRPAGVAVLLAAIAGAAQQAQDEAEGAEKCSGGPGVPPGALGPQNGAEGFLGGRP